MSLMKMADRQWMLRYFPKGYRLYEHVKRNVNEDTGDRAARNHAKGQNERQDAYLYGHPHGRRKRFRSPKDFFFHLHWLATDPEFDDANCTCKMCCPWEVSEIVDKYGTNEEKAIYRRELEQVWAQGEDTAADDDQNEYRVDRKRSFNVMSDISSNSTTQGASSGSAEVGSSSAAGNGGSGNEGNKEDVVQIRCREQELDWSYGQFIYRIGEVVWFERTTAAWGLCVVLRRQMYQATSNTTRPRYLIQPLSNPFAHPAVTVIWNEKQLRPWLGWSPRH